MIPLVILTVAGLLLYAGIHDLTLAETVGIALGRTPHKRESNPSIGNVSLASEPSVSSSSTSHMPMNEEESSVALGHNGITQFDGHPVASWIVPILKWARAHGWSGRVSSGYRTSAQQMAAARSYGLEHYGSAGPLGSNHTGYIWPRGAVDVTQPEELARILHSYSGLPRLVWGGPVMGDQVHFSATGH